MEWHFRKLTPGEPTRDPIVGEFFATDAIENPAKALVREGIQNSLDAKVGDKVSIRIFLSNHDAALAPPVSSKWLDGLWEHVAAGDNGLREPPGSGDPCPFLVFEDFGTTGLQGNPSQAFDDANRDNSFFYFFRAEGRSGKGELDRGRWGVGKHVFPRSSCISTSMGLTVRADDGRHLLMGHAVLRSHRAGDHHFAPDGYLGEKQPNSLIMPVEDPRIMNAFRENFRLKRGEESGLSIVLPHVDPQITFDDVTKAVIEDYFLPILRNLLVVTLEAPGRSITLDSRSLSDPQLMDRFAGNEDLRNKIELARWAASKKEDEIQSLAICEKHRPEWTDDLIGEELRNKLGRGLENGEKIAVRVPLTIHEKKKPETVSHFDVFLWQDGCKHGRPVFIREGIIIPDVRAPRDRGVRSLVVVNDGPLATLLGDSENPAHTQWQKDSSNFKGKYHYGQDYLSFVTKSVTHLVRTVTSQEEEEDRSILLDVFSLPVEKTETSKPRPGEQPGSKQGGESDKRELEIEPKRKRFKIRKIQGGFSVTRGDRGTSPPVFLDIRCAYDVRAGTPLGRYDAAALRGTPDFQIGQEGVEISEMSGVEILTRENNHIRTRITDREFRISVSGFDPNRDLFVKVRMEEVGDDQKT